MGGGAQGIEGRAPDRPWKVDLADRTGRAGFGVGDSVTVSELVFACSI